tara:strand:- start:19 stop:420 length:402 start_codon:yes stop_codon:yes gene_type:complete
MGDITSVDVTEQVTALTVSDPASLSVDITEEITQVSVNNLALPAQVNDASGVAVSPSGSITATNVQDALIQLADHTFRQAAAPSGANVEQGDFWYETDTETLHVYREVSTGVFEWVPILLSTSDSDTLDGGSY